MRRAFILFAGIISFLTIAESSAAVGQSAVITLVFPYGARSAAMGEVGTSLADDASVLFFNPAGLAVPNKKWQGGSGSINYEPLLPAFGLMDLWHRSIAAQYQDSTFWFQPGVFQNYINMGVNEWSNDLGKSLGKSRSHEAVYALGCGFDFKDFGLQNHYFGMTAKFIYSALAPGIGSNGEGIGTDIAFDLGYLWTIGHGFRLGATLMNMGPSIYYIDPDRADPIPFTLNFALGYKESLIFENLHVMDVAGEVRFEREVVKNYSNKNPDPFYVALSTDLFNDTSETFKQEMHQFVQHFGGELTILNTLSLRSGVLVDPMGARYEYHSGFGIHLLNHFRFDWSIIHSPEGFMKQFSRWIDPQQTGATGARHKQFHVSLVFERALFWSEDDFTWFVER